MGKGSKGAREAKGQERQGGNAQYNFPLISSIGSRPGVLRDLGDLGNLGVLGA